jgi:predicted dinucleotide-binding enzyme
MSSISIIGLGGMARAIIERLGLRPLDTGGLATARWLEGAGPLLMGLARHGAGFNISLGVDVPSWPATHE